MRSARFAFFLIFILLGFGLASGYYFLTRPKVNADQLRSLATWGLGDYLAKTHPDSKVLILANPFSTRPKMDQSVIDKEKSGIAGLESGFSNKMASVKVVYPTLISDAYASPRSLIPDNSVTTPLSFLFATNALIQLHDENPDHDLWISLVGLPVEISNQAIWKMEKGPRFALLLPDLRVIGGAEAVANVVRSGKVVAIVLTQQGRMFNTKSMSRDLRKEFDERYLIVSPENVDEIVEKYPELFRMY